MAKQKMRETVLEQSKQENRNEEEEGKRIPGATAGDGDAMLRMFTVK